MNTRATKKSISISTSSVVYTDTDSIPIERSECNARIVADAAQDEDIPQPPATLDDVLADLKVQRLQVVRESMPSRRKWKKRGDRAGLEAVALATPGPEVATLAFSDFFDYDQLENIYETAQGNQEHHRQDGVTQDPKEMEATVIEQKHRIAKDIDDIEGI